MIWPRSSIKERRASSGSWGSISIKSHHSQSSKKKEIKSPSGASQQQHQRHGFCKSCAVVFITALSIVLHFFVNITNNINNLSSRDTVVTVQKKKSVMIIAAHPTSPRRYAAIWSHLKCFSNGFDKVIVSSPPQFKEDMTKFLDVVKSSLLEMKYKIIEARFFSNDRYDFGLWCDALHQKGDGGKNILEDSAFTDYMLINDSILATERTDEFLFTLRKRQLALLSLNYWGQKNSTDSKYWLESPLRVFSKEGMQVYTDTICALPRINWRVDCPQLHKANDGDAKKQKRCIVELSEINVVDHYKTDMSKVYGLYKGNTPLNKHWSHDFEYYLGLREAGFPATKVSSDKFFNKMKTLAMPDLERCTEGYPGDWV